MATILGIDPGSRVTGYGVIRSAGRQTLYLDSGCIRVGSGTLGERLRQIFDGVRELVALHRPDQFAVEQVFMHRNADSALKLGQARGAAIAAAVTAGLTLEEYQPSQIKQAVVGTGRATKEQVQHMVKVLLNLQGAVQADAADALAVALCHAHSGETLARIPAARRMARGRLR